MSSQISLTAIQARMAQDVPKGRVDEPTVRRLWWAALATLQDEILGPMELNCGLWVASPLATQCAPNCTGHESYIHMHIHLQILFV